MSAYDSDHLFISKPEIQKLVALLREIPELVEELSVTLTRQDQLGSGGARVSMGEREQPLPFNVNASEVADDLHNTLVGWVRHVCESRVLDYTGSTSTIGLARWLDRNVIALAMTEGAGTALDEVQYAMRRARWATDRPKPTKVLLGLCEQCGSRVQAEPEVESAMCLTCGEYLTIAAVRFRLDGDMDGMVLPAKEAAAMISIRYGIPIKPKTVYDMAYRKKDPIEPVSLTDGTTAFNLGRVIADLRQKGRIA